MVLRCYSRALFWALPIKSYLALQSNLRVWKKILDKNFVTKNFENFEKFLTRRELSCQAFWRRMNGESDVFEENNHNRTIIIRMIFLFLLYTVKSPIEALGIYFSLLLIEWAFNRQGLELRHRLLFFNIRFLLFNKKLIT